MPGPGGGIDITHQEETGKVLGERGADGDNGPGEHDAAQEERGLDARDQHVRGNAEEDVTDKEDRHAGLVLHIGEAEVAFEGRDFGERDSIAIEVWESARDGPGHKIQNEATHS
jgi:hypothetical protein